MEFVISERQRERLRQIAEHSIHLRKVPHEVRWKHFFGFQASTYRLFYKGFRDRNPELTHEEILELIRKETLRKYGQSI